MKIIKTQSTVAGFTRSERIRLHLLCPWRTVREARFHLTGILREFKIGARSERDSGCVFH